MVAVLSVVSAVVRWRVLDKFLSGFPIVKNSMVDLALASVRNFKVDILQAPLLRATTRLPPLGGSRWLIQWLKSSPHCHSLHASEGPLVNCSLSSEFWFL